MSENDIRLLLEFIVDRIVMTTDEALAYSSPDIPDNIYSVTLIPEDADGDGLTGGVKEEEVCKDIKSEFVLTCDLSKSLQDKVVDGLEEIVTENISPHVVVKTETQFQDHDCGERTFHIEETIKQFFKTPFQEVDSFYFPLLSADWTVSPSGSLSEETIVLIGDSRSSVYDDEISDMLLSKPERFKLGTSCGDTGRAIEFNVPSGVQTIKRNDTPFPSTSIVHNLRSNDQVNVEIFSRGKCSPPDGVQESSEVENDFEKTCDHKSLVNGENCTEDKFEEVRNVYSGQPAFGKIKSKFNKFRRACRKLFNRKYRKSKFNKRRAEKSNSTSTTETTTGSQPRKKSKIFDLLKFRSSILVQEENTGPIKTRSANYPKISRNCKKSYFGKRLPNLFSIFKNSRTKIDGNIAQDDSINVKLISQESNRSSDSILINKKEDESSDMKDNFKNNLLSMEASSNSFCVYDELKNSSIKSDWKQVVSDGGNNISNTPRCNISNVFAPALDNHTKQDSKCLSFVLPFSNVEPFQNVQSFNPFLPASSATDFVCNPFDIVYSGLSACQTVNSIFNPFSRINDVGFTLDQTNVPQNIDNPLLDYIIIDSFPMHVLSGDNLGQDFMPLGISKNATNSESAEDLDEKFVNYASNPLIESACQTIPDNIRDEIMNLKEELEMLKNKKKVNTLKQFFIKLKSSNSISTNSSKKLKNGDINNIDSLDKNIRKCRCIKCEKIRHDISPAGQTIHSMDSKHDDNNMKPPTVLTKVSSSFTKKLSKLFSKVAESVDLIKPERNIEKESSKKALKLFKERQKLLEKMEENSAKQQRLLLSHQALLHNKTAPVKKKYFSRNNRIWPFYSQESTKTKQETDQETCKVTLKLPFMEDPLSAVLLVSDKLTKNSLKQDSSSPCVGDQTNVLSQNYFNELQIQTPNQQQQLQKTPNEMLFPRDTLTKQINEENTEEFFLNQKSNKRICLMDDSPQIQTQIQIQDFSKRDDEKTEIQSDEMYNAIKTFLNSKPASNDKVEDVPVKESSIKKKIRKFRNKPKPQNEEHTRDFLISGPQKICQPGMDKYESYCDNHYCLRNIFPFGNNSLTDQYCKRKNCKNAAGKVQIETFSAPSYFSASNDSMSADSRLHCCNSLNDDKFRPFSTPGWLKYNKSYRVPPSFVRQISFPTPIIRNHRDALQGTSDDWSNDDMPRHRERTSPYGRKQRRDDRKCHQCHHKSSKGKCKYKHYPCNCQTTHGYKTGPKISFQSSSSGTSGIERNECVWFQEFPSQMPSRSRKATRFSVSKHPSANSRSRTHKKFLAHLPGSNVFSGAQRSSLKPSKASLRNGQTKKNRFYFQPRKHNLSFNQPTCSHCNCGDQRKKCSCQNHCSSNR